MSQIDVRIVKSQRARNYLMSKTFFHFEMDGDNIKKLIYDPSLYDYFKEHNIDFRQELADLLIKTKFHQKLDIDEQKIKEIIDHLPFNRKITFNYIFPAITIE